MGTSFPWLSITASIQGAKELRLLGFIYLVRHRGIVTFCSSCDTHTYYSRIVFLPNRWNGEQLLTSSLRYQEQSDNLMQTMGGISLFIKLAAQPLLRERPGWISILEDTLDWTIRLFEKTHYPTRICKVLSVWHTGVLNKRILLGVLRSGIRD